MTQSLVGFRAALLAGWTALSAAGWLVCSVERHTCVDRGSGSGSVPHRISILSGPRIRPSARALRAQPAVVLVVSFIAPYAMYASNTGQFRWVAFVPLTALATALSLWYRILPAAPLADFAFLVLAAAVVLRGYFVPIYTSPVAGLHLDILGHVALTRLCAMVMLVERRVPNIGYGFIPSLDGVEDRLETFRLFPDCGHSAGLGYAVGAPGTGHAGLENRSDLFGYALGGGLKRRILFSRPAPTLDVRLDGTAQRGAGGRVDPVRRGASGISRISQLEIRDCRGEWPAGFMDGPTGRRKAFARAW